MVVCIGSIVGHSCPFMEIVVVGEPWRLDPLAWIHRGRLDWLAGVN